MYLVPICNWTNEFSSEEVGLMVKFKKPSSFAIKFSATVYGVPKTPKLLLGFDSVVVSSKWRISSRNEFNAV